MIKASALYIVLIVSLLIAILSASLIATGYFYRLEQQKSKRFAKLVADLNSGIEISLSSGYEDYDLDRHLDVFNDGEDSVLVRLERWGAFDIASVKAYQFQDTLRKVLLIGKETGLDQKAIYLTDENRPLSISGETRIVGGADIPKAGIKQAYVDGKAYTGSRPVTGIVGQSGPSLPPVNENVVSEIAKYLSDTTSGYHLKFTDSMTNSFYNHPVVLRLQPGQQLSTTLTGKIIVLSDTTVNISRSANLKDVIVYAPAILVENGFRGNCQLFATDSVVVEKDCVFSYPSVIGVIKKSDKIQPRVSIGSNTVFNGLIFTYEKAKSALQTLVQIQKGSRISGEVYSGLLKLEKSVTVNGKVSCNRFIMQTPATLYENYLIDIILDRMARSKYYFASLFSNEKLAEKGVVKWLE